MENSNPKRIKIGLSSSSGTNIEVLHDELLKEIFIRLDCHQTVITCKFVSKHWLSLLSHPKFVIQFINYKKTNSKQTKEALPWTFLPTLRLKQPEDKDNDDNYCNIHDKKRVKLLIKKDKKRAKSLIDNHNKVFSTPSNKYTLNFLPGEYKVVAATFKDLELVYKEVKHEDDPRYYCICNPVTKRWVALPPTPSPAPYDLKRDVDWCKACFICENDPYDIRSSNVDTMIDDDGYFYNRYRFRIIVVKMPTAEQLMSDNSFCDFNLMVFCSEIGRWIEVELRVSMNLVQRQCQRVPLRVLLCKKLVCVSCHQYFGMFDAFFDTTATTTTPGTRYRVEARALPLPSDISRSHLLECGGRLLAVFPETHCPPYRLDEQGSKIWMYGRDDIRVSVICEVLDLNHVRVDDDNGNTELCWKHCHHIRVDDDNDCNGLCWKHCCHMCIDKTRSRCLSVYSGSGIFMCNVHPTNPQLIYIITHDFELLLCDTGSSCLKNLGQCCDLLISPSINRQLPFNRRLELQYWPTPVPTID